MTFEVPWALAGFLLLALLILLDRWRRRPREMTWPSLQLWRAVTETPSAPRRRVDPLLPDAELKNLAKRIATASDAYQAVLRRYESDLQQLNEDLNTLPSS